MKYICGFIFSLCLFATTAAWAQKDSIAPQSKDSVPPKMTRHGLRFGADLYKLTRSFYDSNYKGLEIVGDYRLTRNYYLAAEIGNEDKRTEDSRVDFTTKGTYFKAGFDYNFYENWLDMENVITIGLRYGASTFSQKLHSYKIYNPHPYFGPEQTIESGEEFKGLTASWAEVALGLKVEVISNIYLGFSARMNYLISEKKPTNFDNLYIPGFHRTYDGKFGVGFNYTLTYFLPIYKSKVKPATEKKK